MGKVGRPKGYVQSEETRAKLREAWARRLTGPESETARQTLLEQLKRANENRPRKIPLKGTPERRLFNKIKKTLGAAAAHAELRRGT